MKNKVYTRLSGTKLLIVLCSLFFSISAAAQHPFYDIDQIREIRINFYQSNWDHILDSLYVKGDEDRMLAQIIIDGEVLDSAGIRYKGFSSVSVDRKKNPFNIKLDYVDPEREYQGLDKIKLSNVIQDPSFIRETLSYEIARNYMPASGANFANVFINDTLWGLYTNVEAVDGEFLRDRFGSSNNSFFKCNPEQLDLFGENSTLSNTPGSDTSDYYPYYELKSEFGWKELYSLIDTLNNSKENVESVLNVDRSLWMHAFNYALINFDSYIGYAQNYYLYADDNHIWNPLIWDLNMSFASFRLTDASDNFGGFNIPQAPLIDPLQHYNSVSVFPRPLMRNLFENDKYRKMYLAHLRTIIDEQFATQNYFSRGKHMQDLIDQHVLLDSNKFYSYQAFKDNLNTTVSDLIDYPGISELVNNRFQYLNTYAGIRGEPSIAYHTSYPKQISKGSTVTILSNIINAANVELYYRYKSNDRFQSVTMLDDGLSSDSAAGDGIYAATLSNIGSVVEYYIYAENDSAACFSPTRAAFKFHSLRTKVSPGDLVINEFMADNRTTKTDESGEFDDWIELYNNSSEDIYIGDLFLSDDPSDLDRSSLPDISIDPGNYLIIWADGDLNEPGLHVDFQLNSSGEQLFLSNSDGSIIDSVRFGPQSADFSTGRFPNGYGSHMLLSPTFNANNNTANVISSGDPDDEVLLFPNPATDMLYLGTNFRDAYSIVICDVQGHEINNINVTDNSRHNSDKTQATYLTEYTLFECEMTNLI